MAAKRVAVIGAGVTKFGRRLKETGPELAYLASKMALDSTGLRLKDIDLVVSPTLGEYTEGVGNKIALWSSASGAWRKPIMRTYVGGGAAGFALYLGYCAILSGMAETCLIPCGEKSSPPYPKAQAALSRVMDPVLEQPYQFTGPSIFAPLNAHYLHKYGLTRKDVAPVAVKAKENGMDHPSAMHGVPGKFSVEDILNSPMVAWPVSYLETVSSGDGGSAVLLASENVARRVTDRPVWIEGIGFTMDTFYHYNKCPSDFREVEYTARRAYAMAGIKEPRKEIHVIELWDAFTFWELMFLEAMQICPRGGACQLTADGITRRNGDLPVNPSGGFLGVGQPAGAGGPWRIAEVFWQLRREAGAWQVPGKPRRGIAQVYGGQQQSTAIMIMSI